MADEVYSPDNANKQDPMQSQKQVRGNLNIGEFTGAAIYDYPMALPSGRNGMTPSVSLTYNSQDESLDNIVGYHWSLTQYSIKRINKTGVEKLYDLPTGQTGENNFVATTPIESGELVSIDLSDGHHGNYAQRVETSFSKYEFMPDNSWLITDKRGVKYKFGISDDSRQSDPADPSRIYQWMLEEIRDPNDNFIRYTYYKADNQIYPKEIIYTGHGQDDGVFKVRFLPFADNKTGAIRQDSYYGYYSGFRIATNYLVGNIEVYANDQLRKKYEINYSAVDPLVRQTIGNITETGYDINGNAESLPATVFDYTPSEVKWEETNDYYPEWFFESCYNECYVVNVYDWDMTGDGLIDFEYVNTNEIPAQGYRAVNNGKGGWTITMAGSHSIRVPDVGAKPVDFDGDTLTDIIMSGIGLDSAGYFGKIWSWIYLTTGKTFMDTIKIPMYSGEQNNPDNGATFFFTLPAGKRGAR